MSALQRFNDLPVDVIEDALFSIPADLSREKWARIGMALKSELGEAGAPLFHDWSRQATSYNERDCADTWKSISAGGGVGIATLIYEAQQHGFKLGEGRARLSEDDKRERERQREADHKRAAEEKRARQAEAAKRANLIWDAAERATVGHAYLAEKGVRAHGLGIGEWPVYDDAGEVTRTIPGALIIPIADAKNGRIVSLQAIMAERRGGFWKSFLKNGRMSGGCHMIGETYPDQPLAIAEGYATAATIHELTGWPVAVAFSSGNLKRIASALRARFQNAGIIVCGDRGNGEGEAIEAAQVSGGIALLPTFAAGSKGTDFNDLAHREGDEIARKQLFSGIEQMAIIKSKSAESGQNTPGADLQSNGKNSDATASVVIADSPRDGKVSVGYIGDIRLPVPGNDNSAGHLVVSETVEHHEISEDAMALAFVNANADHLRFDHDAGKWFIWNGARWAKDTQRLAFSWARETQRQMAAGDRKEAALLRASVCRGIETFAQTDPRISCDATVWDADPMLLGTPGGTVDLRTGEMRVAHPADHITKCTAVAPVDGEPVRWLAFLEEVTGGDAEMIRFLQQWAGYSLTGDTREQQMLFAYGPGGNGKSVFLETLQAIMGNYAATAQMDTFTARKFDGHSTDLAMLAGARLVTASETDAGKSWNEARIKQLTGGDKITARFMRQDNFTFTPQFKLTIIGNHRPAIRNVDEAMRRRLNLVPFTVTPARKDTQLPAKLAAEHGQILSWAIQGCLDWQASGLVRPAAVVAATDEYCASQDVLGEWITERCDTGPGKRDFPKALYDDYRSYLHQTGEEPLTLKGFSEELEKRGFEGKKSSGVRWRMGIALRVPDIPPGAPF